MSTKLITVLNKKRVFDVIARCQYVPKGIPDDTWCGFKSANQLPVQWRPTVKDYKSSGSAFGIQDPVQRNSNSFSFELSSLNFKLSPLSRMFRRASRTTHDADLKSANQLPMRLKPTVEDYKSSVSAFGIAYPEQRRADFWRGTRILFIKHPSKFDLLVRSGSIHPS